MDEHAVETELPPSYEEALRLPGRTTLIPAQGEKEDVEERAVSPRVRRQSSSFLEHERRLSIPENEAITITADDETYSVDDEAFEPYDDEDGGASGHHDGDEEGRRPKSVMPLAVDDSEDRGKERPCHVDSAPPRRRRSHRDTASTSIASSLLPSPPSLVYDDQTYSIVSKLRALNRQLTAKIDGQHKQIVQLQDEKKQQQTTIQTLQTDLRMLKQTLKALTSAGERTKTPEKPPPARPKSQQDEGELLPHFTTVASPPRTPRSMSRPSTTPPTSPRRSGPPVSSSSSRSSSPVAPQSTNEKLLLAKVEKLEQDKRDLADRHAHQLANYSHELSRLERQLDSAQKLAQAKDYELRLQKSRHLYAGSPTDSSSSAKPSPKDSHHNQQSHHQYATLLADELWKHLLPSAPPASTLLALPFTSHVGLAFEQLLGHQLLSFHDHMVDATTRDWLHEIRRCGRQLLQLHHTFQCMALTLKKLAECCHIYELAETFCKETQQLVQAEQAFLFVMDPAENEFWCRVPRAGGSAPSGTNTKNDMITVRSRVMPLSGHGGVSAVAAEHSGVAQAQPSSAMVPCGLASYVYHTKKPLLIPAGQVPRHAHYSTAPDNTDRLMHLKSASTLLLPVLHGSTTLGVVQVCGKLTHVAALGVALSLEKCDAFTLQDQVCLTLLGQFVGGVLPKAAYFTEVESNKVNEETLIQLAPEIFTCLRFDELGKMVIQHAKTLLDADRCSLFVADNDERMLFNWQSDISGKGGVEVIADVKKHAMRIPFGHGLVGMVAETKTLINIPDAYEDSRFNSSWDKKSNYRTKSILTVPILTTLASKHTKRQAPIRRRRSQQDVYGAVIMGKDVDVDHADAGDGESEDTGGFQQQQSLLGVVQVINKSGGAPFRSKDEFLLQTISKLIALAIENSQLFQKTQQLCASLGKLIADADLVEAIATLGACAEDIIGVESAAIYVLPTTSGGSSNTTTGATTIAAASTIDARPELVTFHRKRRHKIVIKEQMYRHSLLEQALTTKELVIVNDVAHAPQFNAYVDTVGGLAARNVLFMPLLVVDPEDPTASEKKLIGVLHLVNTRGRKLTFEPFDLFLSIVGSQACSVLASILEKQAMLRHQEQTRHLLDTTMGFFKEMSPVGIINAVYNTCASLFAVDKAHLFLWDERDHRAMWTAKLSPTAETVSHAMLASSSAGSDLSMTTSGMTTVSAAGGGGGGGINMLRTQARRISVLTDQKIRVPTTEGLLEHVLGKSAMVVVKYWLEPAENEDATDDEEAAARPKPSSRSTFSQQLHNGSSLQSIEGSKYVLRACRADTRAGFTKHAVVACPVWDLAGIEIVGVVVLLFPRGKAPAPSELGNLPILSRQIAGALNVCGDLGVATQRCDKLHEIVERFAPRPAVPTMSLTLTSRGQLAAFSQPLNVTSVSFSAAALAQFVNSSSSMTRTTAATSSSTTPLVTVVDPRLLPLDEDGHRWVFALSSASLGAMCSDHYVKWVGQDVGGPSGAFDKLRTDLQSVYIRKEPARGTVVLVPESDVPIAITTSTSSLPKNVVVQLRRLLWEFCDAQSWHVDVKKACGVFDPVDAARARLVSRKHLEQALTSNGRCVELDQLEWDLLHAQFADPDTDLVPVERMFSALAPRFRVVPRFAYELIPILDSITQSVTSVHILLTAR